MLNFPLLLNSKDQIHFAFPKQGTFTNKLRLFQISLLVCGRGDSFAYNTIPTAEELLNGDVYCTLSD
jgi:hypothetical protein